ncbi:MAG: zinc-ribbon domain-containing protein [Dehalococcoidia bacterium]|nr:zinc-ribbon domain-containing protein [Dehalococcoidia bacterium]
MFNEVAAQFCARCGTPLAAGARFCSACGTVVGASSGPLVSNCSPTIELAGTRYELASFWRRAGAFFVDWVFWQFVSWPLSTIFNVPAGNSFPTLEPGAPPTPEFYDALAQTMDHLLVYLAVYSLVAGVAQAVLEAYGWTPGKATFGLRVIRRDGHPPGTVHGLARIFTRLLSALPFLLGYFWVVWDPQKQAWHDKLAQVYVVRVPDPVLNGGASQRPPGWGPLTLGVGPWIWAALQTLFLCGTVAGALFLSTITPDDGPAWQRFFDSLATPTPARSPGSRTSAAPPAAPFVRLIAARDVDQHGNLEAASPLL